MTFNILIWDDEPENNIFYLNILSKIQLIACEKSFKVTINGKTISESPFQLYLSSSDSANYIVSIVSDSSVEALLKSGSQYDLAIIDENYATRNSKYGSEVLVPLIKAAHSETAIVVATHYATTNADIAQGLMDGDILLWLDKRNLKNLESDVARILASLAVSIYNNKAKQHQLISLKNENIELTQLNSIVSAITELNYTEPPETDKNSIIGKSRAMAVVYNRIKIFANNKYPIFLGGESGTGKSHFAEYIHSKSRNDRGKFKRLNCSTLDGMDGNILNSRLFGHVKGAFHGANSDYDGILAQSNGGTLFLDEIVDLPYETQTKLLTFIDTGEISPLGADNRTIKVDVRIITATNRDITSYVSKGLFRNDLYNRLQMDNPIMLPPLRERKEDIPLMARHIINTIMTELKYEHFQDKFNLGSAKHFYDYLASRSWRGGNIRSLRTFLRNIIVGCNGRFNWLSDKSLFNEIFCHDSKKHVDTTSFDGVDDLCVQPTSRNLSNHGEIKHYSLDTNNLQYSRKNTVFERLLVYELSCTAIKRLNPNAKLTKKIIIEHMNIPAGEKMPKEQSISTFFSEHLNDIIKVAGEFPNEFNTLKTIAPWQNIIESHNVNR